MSISIRDVARAAGVSVATISRVLNDKGPVKLETRERVLAAVATLGYVPNGAARSLITRRTRTLGALLPDLYGEFFSELIRGIDLAARRVGYHLLVSGSHSDRDEAEAVLRTLSGRVDGLIVMSPDVDADALLSGIAARVPVVLLNRDGNGRLPAIVVDNYGGARAMTRHLLDRGHRRIAMIGGPAHNHDARERMRGWRDELAAAGVAATPDLELPGDFSEVSGHLAGQRLAALAPRPSAVFAANDAMAVGCLAALREAGLRVPEDVALGGFDDIPIVRYLVPALTTVRVSIADLGERALQRLLGLIERPNMAPDAAPDLRVETVTTELVVRASCGGVGTLDRPTRKEAGP